MFLVDSSAPGSVEFYLNEHLPSAYTQHISDAVLTHSLWFSMFVVSSLSAFTRSKICCLFSASHHSASVSLESEINIFDDDEISGHDRALETCWIRSIDFTQRLDDGLELTGKIFL